MKYTKPGAFVYIPLPEESSRFAMLKGNRKHLPIDQQPWELPGGEIELGESPEAAAIREAREETGLDIEIVRCTGIFRLMKSYGMLYLFQGRAVGGELLQTTSETTAADFLRLEEALREPIMPAHHKLILWSQLPGRPDGKPWGGWLTEPPQFIRDGAFFKRRMYRTAA